MLATSAIIALGGGAIAADAAINTDPVSYLINAGIVGVVLILVLFGWLVPKYVHDRVLEENVKKDLIIDRKDQLLLAAQATLADRAIPALTEANNIMKATPQNDNNLLKLIMELQVQVSSLTKRTYGGE